MLFSRRTALSFFVQSPIPALFSTFDFRPTFLMRAALFWSLDLMFSVTYPAKLP